MPSSVHLAAGPLAQARALFPPLPLAGEGGVRASSGCSTEALSPEREPESAQVVGRAGMLSPRLTASRARKAASTRWTSLNSLKPTSSPAP